MSLRMRMRGLVALFAMTAAIAGAGMLLGSSRAEAARCCWVMVCNDIGCWEVCKTCPKFP